MLSVTLYTVKINSITSDGVDKSLFIDDFDVSYQSKHKIQFNPISTLIDNTCNIKLKTIYIYYVFINIECTLSH